MDKDIKRVSREEQVLEMLQRGKTVSEIALELRMSRSSVRTVIENWVRVYNQKMANNAEEVVMTALMRLDYLYEQLTPFALSRVDEETGVVLPPDPKMLVTIKQLLAESREWVKLYLDVSAKRAQEPNVTIEPTISDDDYLYVAAFESVGESGGGDEMA